MKQRNKIIFLCTGNICRSPMGEALLKHAIAALPESDPLKKFEIISAGTSTINGVLPSINSVIALEKVGIDISSYRSTVLTQDLVDECFALFGMESSHLDALKHQFKNLPPHVFTVLEMCPINGRTYVPDPYGGDLDEYIDVRDDIMQAVPTILKYLQNELKKS